MKKIKFKSLTMRIWTTFTAIILVIIFSISLLYLVAFRKINERAKIQDLKVTHDIILQSGDFDQQVRFDELGNLKGIDYFVFQIDGNQNKIIDRGKKIDDTRPQNKPSQNQPPQSKPPQSQQPQGKDPLRLIEDNYAAKAWMASFISEENVIQRQFKEKYNNKEFIFIISSIESDKAIKTYLISYLPNTTDNRLLYMFIIVGIVFIVIGFFAAKIVASRISRPLKELENYTLRIANKDWKEPIAIYSEDEIGRLADSMNHMQIELKRAEEEEKMFLQSISHDLKTPVMVIMSHAEAIIDGVYIESVEKTAEIIRDEAIGLEKKIKQILYLNTLDYIMDNNSEENSINLRSFILHIISRFEVINSQIEWELDISEIQIEGNSDKLKVAIENILDNALRYAKNKIVVSLKEEDGFAILEIYNDGPNISSNHIDYIFDNLYKDKTGNFGLGLAISKKIVDFHKGEISAANREQGVSFLVNLPIS